jgi:N-acetylneuraminic acid mutarotase
MGAGFAVRRVHTLDAGTALTGSALIGTTLYMLGGTDDMNKLSHATRALLAVDLSTGRTTRLADYPEPAFMIGAFTACGDSLFAVGGARWDAAAGAVANLSAAHAFSLSTQRWEKLPPLPHVIRGITAVALDDRHILLAGGYKNDEVGFTDDAMVFDVKTHRYTPTKPLPYKAMVSLVQNGEWLYCLGGEDKKAHRTDAAFRIRRKELLPR